MSTTIKPLELYVEGTKVYPDVNLDILNSILAQTNVPAGVDAEYQRWLTAHTANDNSFDSQYFIVLYGIVDSDDSPFHTNNYTGSIATTQENYWRFNNISKNVLDYSLEIDAKWCLNTIAFNEDMSMTFRGLKTPTIKFKSGSKLQPSRFVFGDNSQYAGDPLFTNYMCRNMFNDCTSLVTIENLDMSEQCFAETSKQVNQYDFKQAITGNHSGSWDIPGPYYGMFSNCPNLKHFVNTTWPEYFYGKDFNYMFYNCTQYGASDATGFPTTLKLRPYNFNWPEDPTYWATISINNAFEYTQLSAINIDNDSWQYIVQCSHAWSGTNIHSIDIPATATNLINVNSILGDIPQPIRVEGQPDDYSNCRYIIRTTAPMTAQLNGVDGANCLLFNFWDIDGNYDTFGGIYVPDSQVSDWQTYISNTGGTNIATYCVHGLSEL